MKALNKYMMIPKNIDDDDSALAHHTTKQAWSNQEPPPSSHSRKPPWYETAALGLQAKIPEEIQPDRITLLFVIFHTGNMNIPP